MGSMASREIRWVLRWMPASAFSALSRAEAAAPISSEVLPTATRPSGSWMAAAGSPVSSALFSAVSMTGRSWGPAWACFISSSSLYTISSLPWPLRRSHRAA
jgi:hypothetical protein